MSDDAIEIILGRLCNDAQLIDRMVRDDHRQRYFEALRLKKSDPTRSNVTAAFFPDLRAGALSGT